MSIATRENAVKNEPDIERRVTRYQLVATTGSCLSNMRGDSAGHEHGEDILVEKCRPISKARGDVASLHSTKTNLAGTILTAIVSDFARPSSDMIRNISVET